MQLRSAVLALTATLGLTGQSVLAQSPIGYPQEGNRGLWVLGGPFGSNRNGGNDEVRTHMVIPATHLPSTGGTILGLEVLPGTSGAVTYSKLEIDLGHRPRGTSPLSANLADNLVGLSTQNVMAGANSTETYQQRVWHRFDFQTPFTYDGSSDLLLEVRKWALGGQGNVDMRMFNERASVLRTVPAPRGLRQMVFTKGASGSGAHLSDNATETAMPLRVRLLFQSLPTLAVSSEPTSIGTVFAIGTTVNVTLHAEAGTGYLTLLQAAPNPAQAFLPGAGAAPNIQGDLWVFGSPLPFGVVAGGTNRDTQPLPLPYLPALINYHFALQAVAATPGGRTLWTNACDFVVHP